MNLKMKMLSLFCSVAEARAQAKEAVYQRELAEATLRARELELEGLKKAMAELSAKTKNDRDLKLTAQE